MKRTNSLWRQATDVRRVLPLLILVLIGCGCGVAVYALLRDELPASVTGLLALNPVTGGVRGGFSQLFTTCFQPLCLLAVLFLSGLSACGAPVILLAPLFWGIGLGLSLAHTYTVGTVGLLAAAVFVLPPALPEAIALLIGGVGAMRMSLHMAGQLLPHGAHCGGLWQTFRWYCLRFLLVVPLLLLSGLLDVVLRLGLLRFFPAVIAGS